MCPLWMGRSRLCATNFCGVGAFGGGGGRKALFDFPENGVNRAGLILNLGGTRMRSVVVGCACFMGFLHTSIEVFLYLLFYRFYLKYVDEQESIKIFTFFYAVEYIP